MFASIKHKIYFPYIILTFIFFLGISLRIYDLAFESFWTDEAWMVNLANGSFRELFTFALKHLHPSILYQFLLHFWVDVFGESEFAVRFLSCLFGVACVPSIYLLGKTTYGYREGLVSAFILSVSVYHLQYSQEARAYSLSAFLSILSVYYFVRFIQEATRANIVKYIISSTLLLYSQVLFVSIIFAQNIFFFLYQDKEILKNKVSLKRWLLSQAILLLFFSLCFSVFIFHNSPIERIRNLYDFIPEVSADIVFLTLVNFSGSVVTAYLFIGTLLGFYLWTFLNKSKGEFLSQYDVLMIILFVLPIICLFCVSEMFFPIYRSRYLICCTIPLYLLLGKALVQSPKYLGIIMFFIITGSSLTSVSHYYKDYNKQRAREAVSVINKQALPDDIVVVYPGYYEKFSFGYYFKRDDLEVLYLDRPNTFSSTEIAYFSKQVLKISNSGERIWFIGFWDQDEFPEFGNEKYPSVLFNQLSRDYTREYYLEYESKSFVFREKFIGVKLALFNKNTGLHTGSGTRHMPELVLLQSHHDN